MSTRRCLVSALLLTFAGGAAIAQPVGAPASLARPSATAPLLWPVQRAPRADELSAYEGLHAAAATGDVAAIAALIAASTDVDGRDGHGRTPLMVAAHRGDLAVARALIAAGADVNAFDRDRYDVLTIAAVRGDVAMVRLAIEVGADTRLVTSPFDGTALIAASHLGHVEVVAGADRRRRAHRPCQQSALDGAHRGHRPGRRRPRHVATVRALVDAGADVDLADGPGTRPLTLARQRGFDAIAAILEQAGAQP